MKARPIPFSPPMVRAQRAGTKTQTRRIINPQPHARSTEAFLGADGIWRFSHPTARCPVSYVADDVRCPYGRRGDQLWVREAWHVGKCADGFKPSELHPGTWMRDNGGLWYPADSTEPLHPISPRGRYRHARFMPRWASRILLEITDVRVQRLHEISEEDAQAEGLIPLSEGADRTWTVDGTAATEFETAREAYAVLWDAINGAGSWDANPWVWAVSFRGIKP